VKPAGRAPADFGGNPRAGLVCTAE